ncbi:hypothetical protein FQR65_LT16610 [Abscondita terminalis]|nr:hypothetical protein FQR65_LT16610 [Abscondita terminalis]
MVINYAFEKGMNYFLALGSVLLTTAVLLLSLISIIFVFKKQSGLIHKSTSNSTSNSQNTMDLVNRFNQNNDEENQQPNFNFTSTPTEAPSAQDKINELRESLANDNLENAQFDETEYEQTVINHQEESTNEIQSQIEQVEAEIELLKNQQSNLESQNNIDTQPILNKPQEVNRVEQKVSTAVKNYESSPKDPYLQTIVPRRAVQKAADFSKPIGNKRLSESNNFRERNAKVDQSYQNKVFLGDSDRI